VFYGVYASDVNGRPSTILAAGSLSANTTGVKSAPIALTLQKGDVVWDAVLVTGAEISVSAFTPIFCDGATSATTSGTVVLSKENLVFLPSDATALLGLNTLTTSKIMRLTLRAA